MHENSQQFANMSQLVKIAKILYNYSYAPLGGAIAEKPAFGPITPKPSLDPAEPPDIGHAHFRLDFYA